MLCFFQVAAGSDIRERDDAPHKPVWHFAVALARSPYLLALAAYMFLYTISSTFAYLEQARLVQASVHGDAARTALFARMDLAVNLASIVLQLLLTSLLLRRAGVTATLLILPVVTVVGFAALAAHPTLWVIIGFQVARRTADYFAARPAREMCFVVVGREEKYAAKSFIDTFIYRGGDALGASAFGLVGSVASIVALPLCVAWIVVAIFLGARQRRLSLLATSLLRFLDQLGRLLRARPSRGSRAPCWRARRRRRRTSPAPCACAWAARARPANAASRSEPAGTAKMRWFGCRARRAVSTSSA